MALSGGPEDRDVAFMEAFALPGAGGAQLGLAHSAATAGVGCGPSSWMRCLCRSVGAPVTRGWPWKIKGYQRILEDG